jgi:hypothetical protein
MATERSHKFVCTTIEKMFGFDTRQCCPFCHNHNPLRLFRAALLLVGAPPPLKDEILVGCCKSLMFVLSREHENSEALINVFQAFAR